MCRFSLLKLGLKLILAFLRNHNQCLKSFKHIILQSVNRVCGYDAVYPLNMGALER